MLCSEVIWCDVTTQTTRISSTELFILQFNWEKVGFLWIWILNQQQFSFRWAFQNAIPTLIPKYTRGRVAFIVKDGDPQQNNELLSVLKEVFPSARTGACGWHIDMLYVIIVFVILNINILTQNVSYYYSQSDFQGPCICKKKIHVKNG